MATFFRYDTWVKSAQGPAIPGSQIYVCTQPSNLVIPPTPLALIYSDPNGLVPITQPLLTDGLGHADFYALPGFYTLIVAYNGVLQQSYPDQCLGNGSNSIILKTNGTTNTTQSTLNLVAGTSIGLSSDASGDVTISSTGTPLPAAQTGDTIRYNVNGDSAWDPVNASVQTGMIYAFYTNTNTQFGASGFATVPTTGGSLTGVYPTTTDSGGITISSTNSASVNTVMGWNEGAGTGTSRYGFGSFYRWTLRFAAGNTVNVRYWFGLTVFNSGGSGTETEAALATSKFATDTPNCSTIGFRFSAGTDTAWKGITQVTGGSQTAVNTGVAMDTNSHTFEFTFDGTTVRFFIDNNFVGSSTTNIPATSTIYVEQFLVGDNKNTATAISGTTYHVLFSIK